MIGIKPMKVTFQHQPDRLSDVVEQQVYVSVVPVPGDTMELNDILFKVIERKFHFQYHRDGLQGFHTQTAVIKLRKVDLSGKLDL